LARVPAENRLTRVAMVGPARSVRGGVSAVANSLLDAMPEGAAEFRYVDTYVDGSKLRRAAAAFCGLFHLLWLLLVWKPDIAHVHTASRASYWRKSFLTRLAGRAGCRVVLHVHGGAFKTFYEEQPPSRRAHIRSTLESADIVIALTEKWKERLAAIAPRADIRVLTNPVDCATFAPTVTGRPPVPEGGGTVLFLGALDRLKGIFDLMDAGVTVVAGRPHVVFELGGDRAVEEVRAHAAARGLSNNVRVLGWVRGADKLDAFRRAHVFVLPSYREGLPVAILESLAAGLPIVTTPVGGIPDVITEGENGFFVEPGNVEALANRILRLLDDAELRKSMSRRNAELAAEDHDAVALARKLVLLYDEVMSE